MKKFNNQTTSRGGGGVQRIVCPTVRLPESMRRGSGDGDGASGKKRKLAERGDMGWDREAFKEPATAEVKKQRREEYDRRQQVAAEREELAKAMNSIKDFASTTFEGLSKKKHKEEKLTKLGAPRVKEQTMPFRMKMGILSARAKREARLDSAARQAGIVTARPSGGDGGLGKKDRKRSAESSDRGIDVPVKSGVFRLSRDKLPRNLMGRR